MLAFGQMGTLISIDSSFDDDIASCEYSFPEEVISSPLYHSFQDAELPVSPIGSLQTHYCVRLIHSLSPPKLYFLKYNIILHIFQDVLYYFSISIAF